MGSQMKLTEQTLIHFLALDAGKIPTLNKFHCDWLLSAMPSLYISQKLMRSEDIVAIQRSGFFRVAGARLTRLSCSVQEVAESCTSLSSLSTQGCANLTLAGLDRFRCLRAADFSHCDNIYDLAPLGRCASMQYLNLSYCSRVCTLNKLEGCKKLVQLHLKGCCGLRDVSGLRECTKLTDIDLTYCSALVDFNPLLEYTALERINLGNRKLCDLPVNADVKQRLSSICMNDLEGTWTSSTIDLNNDSGTAQNDSWTRAQSRSNAVDLTPQRDHSRDLVSSHAKGSSQICQKFGVPKNNQGFMVLGRGLQCVRCSFAIHGVLRRSPAGEPLHWGCAQLS